MYKKEQQSNKGSRAGKKDPHARRNWSFVANYLGRFVTTYVGNPILVGLILYGRDVVGGEWGVRVCIAWSLIVTSYIFLGALGALPSVGTYTNMISKVCFISEVISKENAKYV